MATVKLWTDAEAEAHPKVKAGFRRYPDDTEVGLRQ